MNRWSLKRTSDATSEPVTPVDLADHMGLAVNDQDTWLLKAIKAARQFTEVVQQRQLLTATWRLALDYFPSWELKIPMPPLIAISSIAYLDTAGNSQTLSSSLYLVDIYSEPGRVTPAYSQIWPTTQARMAAVTVTYAAGYASAAAIPSTTILPLMSLAAELYEHREMTAEQAAQKNPTLLSMLEADRVLDFSGPLGSSSNVPFAVSAWGNTWL